MVSTTDNSIFLSLAKSPCLSLAKSPCLHLSHSIPIFLASSHFFTFERNAVFQFSLCKELTSTPRNQYKDYSILLDEGFEANDVTFVPYFSFFLRLIILLVLGDYNGFCLSEYNITKFKVKNPVEANFSKLQRMRQSEKKMNKKNKKNQYSPMQLTKDDISFVRCNPICPLK